jgi:two-component system, OmpR family, phosphate regulon sensor histidine kinase PhoR
LKIRHQLLLTLLLSGLAISAAVGAVSVRLLRGQARAGMVERIRAETGLLAASLRSADRSLDLQAFAVEARRQLGYRVTLIDHEGSVLADSSLPRGDVPSMENHLERPEIRDAESSGMGDSLRTSHTTGVDYFYAARRVNGDGPAWFARLALPASQLDHLPGTGWLVASSVLGAALLLQSILAYGIVHRMSRRVEDLGVAADEVGEEKRQAPLRYEVTDELGDMTAAINRRTRSLKDRIASAEERGRLLSAAVAGIKEGLLVIGPDRRVLLANDAFRTIFRTEVNPAGRLLAEVIRDPTVMNDLDAALREGHEIQEAMFHAADLGRSFELHVTPLGTGTGEPGGAIILFFDITRLETLENVRRDFVANVSHELRTPLTSIKAFVETLVHGGLENREDSLEFLEIVDRHVDRMEALIDDLTDLSLIETASVRLEIDRLDVRAMALEITEHLTRARDETEVTVQVDLPSPFYVRADRRRLEQILVNLVDNGIKFNRPGGTVRISGCTDGARTLLHVEDTGLGIPPDSLERVFNRFYRVDKARSREVGGTGLGLAIVKHLMRLHGGSVRVESEHGRGSRFILEFPGPVD